MDFEIDQKGVLLSYRGKGGHVHIPEGVRYIATQGVFDSNVVITSIFLPKSFYGFYENRPETSYYRYIDTHGIVRIVDLSRDLSNPKDMYCEDPEDYDKDTRHFLGHNLPHLERYEVHVDNEHYAQRNGVLFNKNYSLLVSCPKNYKDRVVIDAALKKVDKEAFSDRVETISLEYGEAYASDALLKELAGKFRCNVKFYAPNLVNYEGHPYCSIASLNGFILIWPKVDINHIKDYLIRRVALGVCYASELYDEEHIQFYQALMRDDDEQLYLLAQKESLKEVKDLIERMWGEWNLFDYMSYRGKVDNSVIQNCVLHGTFKELKRLLTDHPEDLFTTEALLLSSRYGSYEKAKLLLDNADFSQHFGSNAKDRAFYDNIKIALLVMPPSLVNYGFISCIALGDLGEFHNLKVISQKERIKILKLLIKRDIIDNTIGSFICLVAMVNHCSEIADFLSEEGYIPNLCLNRCSKNIVYSSFCGELIATAARSSQDNFIKLIKLLKDKGTPLGWKSFFDNSLLYANPALTEAIFKYINIPSKVAETLITYLIEDNDSMLMAAILASGYIKSKQNLEKYLQMSIDNHRPEITSMILKYQDSKRRKKSTPSKLDL